MGLFRYAHTFSLVTIWQYFKASPFPVSGVFTIQAMRETKDYIDRFWKDELTHQELTQLLEQLEQKEPQWADVLRQEYHQPADKGAVLSEEQATRILGQLHTQIKPIAADEPKKTLNFSSWIKRSAAAVLIVTAGLVIYQSNTRDHGDVGQQQQVQEQWVALQNDGGQAIEKQLPDGSLVTLQPGSAITYNRLFGEVSRKINLQGAAKFAVHKDAAHPFAVTARGFTTTALGTVFEVSAQAGNMLEVKLHEGKVVVHAEARGSHIKDAYLVPGDEFKVNTVTHEVKRTVFKTTNDTADINAGLPVAKVKKEPKLVFNKEPLQQVLRGLGKWYKVKIVFDTTAVQGLSFTGTFGAADALDVALSAVCNMNGLSFSRKEGEIIVRKEQ